MNQLRVILIGSFVTIFVALFLVVNAFAEDSQTEPSGRGTGLLDNLLSFPVQTLQDVQRSFGSRIFNLGEVRVSGGRISSKKSDQAATDVPHNITVISAHRIEESGVFDLPEILSQQEGVNYTDETGLGFNARVDLRGFGGEAKQTLVIFDGLRAVEPFDNNVAWHLYPKEFLKQVEIERGGGATVYGEGALSGLINLKTKESTETLKISARAEAGDFNTQKLFVDASGTKGGVGFYAGGHALTTKGYRNNADHEGFSFLLKNDAELTDLIQVENSLYFADNETGIPGPLSAAEVLQDPRQQDPDGRFGDRFIDKLVQDRFTIIYDIEPIGVELSNQTGYRLRNQDSLQRFGGAFPGTSINNIETETFSNVSQLNWSLEGTGYRSELTAGLELSKDDIHNPFEFLDETFGPFSSERAIDRRMVGVFVQNLIELWDRWILELGLRWDRIDWEIYNHKSPELQKEKKADHFSPKIGLEWRPWEALAFYGSFAESFKVPDANTLIFETPNLFTPNPDLDPQVARHYEAGVRYAHPVFGSVRGNYFLVATKKEILFNDISNLNENFDTRRQGVEVAAEVAPNPALQLFANFTYTNAEFDNGAFDGKTIPLVPESKWSAGFLWEIVKHLTLSAHATGVYDQFALNDLNNIFPVDDYWVLGGKLSYEKDDWEAYVQVQNLLGEEYTSFVTSNAVDTLNLNPAPESFFLVGVKIEV